jgi:thiol-disulfide isomerase/thioredoxin
VSETPSTMLPLGSPASDFTLPEPATGGMISLKDFQGAPAFLLMVLSNHCPFVKHVADELADFGRDYEERGVGIVAICGNDVTRYPADSPEKMAVEVVRRGYSFPYLFDETQDTLKAYRAACTPDFFLFDGYLELVYRGQFDSSRPSLDTPVTGADLRAACDAVLTGRAPDPRQMPSIGCNIKWRPGNEPNRFTVPSV